MLSNSINRSLGSVEENNGLILRQVVDHMDGEFYIQWHITEKCNLRCLHCYQESHSSNDLESTELEMVANIILLTLKKWRKSGRIALTGGEPFLSKNLPGLLRLLNESEQISYLSVLSNGTVMNQTDIHWLKEISKLKQIQISLDGATAETHDRIRGKGVFNKAIETIRLLRANGLEITLMFTLHRGNMQDVPQLIELAIKEKVNALTVERVTPCGSVNDLKNLVLSPNELRDVYQYVAERAENDDVMESGLVIRRNRTLWVNTYKGQNSSDIVGGFCPVGLTSLAILHDGTVLPCRRLNIPLGNILEDGLFKIWYNSSILWEIRDKRNLKGKCNGCKHVPSCGGCRAIAYELTGDYMGEDPQCWR